MSDKTLPVCPHDTATFVSEPNLSSMRCLECNARVCRSCKRYGETGFMIPLVSWMTGTCDDCYRDMEKRKEIRKEHQRESQRRKALRAAWDAGRAAGPDDVNPHTEPDYSEARLLADNSWLADEVAALEAEYAEIARQQGGA